MIRVALRFDDPGPTSDHALEKRIIALLQRYKVPATFAVIPFHHADGETYPLQAGQVPHLIHAEASGHIEIAQHGYSHEKRVSTNGILGEFVCLSAGAQAERIRWGRDCLKTVFGTLPSGFVPPWNSYERTTLACLRDVGFAYISAGWEGPLSRDVSVIPRTCNVKDIQATVEKARTHGVSVTIIGVMHHYDFREYTQDTSTPWSLENFEKLLTWLALQTDLELHTLATLSRLYSPWDWFVSFSIYRFTKRMPWRVIRRLPPDCLLRLPGDGNRVQNGAYFAKDMQLKKYIKSILKGIVPLRLRLKIRAIQSSFHGLEYKYKGLKTQDVFDKIYTESVWGKNEDDESTSGPGSHNPDIVGPYVQQVLILIKQLNCSSIIDLGCGDFNVGKNFVDKCESYIACDISTVIQERNVGKFRHDNLSFLQLNLAEDELPVGDIACVRQVLQHLSNSDIASFVRKVNATQPYKYLLVTEHLPVVSDFIPNLDKPAGPNTRVGLNSGVVLDKPPFNLKYRSKRIVLDIAERTAGRDATICSVLYEI